MRYDKNRLSAIEFTVFVVLCGNNAIDGGFDECVFLKEIELVLCLVVLEFYLVVVLLADGPVWRSASMRAISTFKFPNASFVVLYCVWSMRTSCCPTETCRLLQRKCVRFCLEEKVKR